MLNVNTIYPAFDGEQNPWGIGHPTVFVRFQGCHLRCYLKTLGVVCDTPEALDMKRIGHMYDPHGLSLKVLDVLYTNNIDKITISGGDPLKQDPQMLKDFISAMNLNGFNKITIETSGTLDWAFLKEMNPEISIIADYKLSSTGVKTKLTERMYTKERLSEFHSNDYIKFVIYDEADYTQMRDFLQTAFLEYGNQLYIEGTTTPFIGSLCAGTYYKGEMTNFELFERLRSDRLLRHILMNFQVHQMVATLEKVSKTDI